MTNDSSSICAPSIGSTVNGSTITQNPFEGRNGVFVDNDSMVMSEVEDGQIVSECIPEVCDFQYYCVPEVDYVNFKFPPYTIVHWKDGTTTKTKCSDDDYFDRDVGFAICVAKKMFPRGVNKVAIEYDLEERNRKKLAEKDSRRKEHEQRVKDKKNKKQQAYNEEMEMLGNALVPMLTKMVGEVQNAQMKRWTLPIVHGDTGATTPDESLKMLGYKYD